MRQEIKAKHKVDENGNPTGGMTTGLGIKISWQDGPLGRGDERQPPNGAFVEGVIQAAIERLVFYQRSKFVCHENNEAIEHLTRALAALDRRTIDRLRRGVEGEHKV